MVGMVEPHQHPPSSWDKYGNRERQPPIHAHIPWWPAALKLTVMLDGHQILSNLKSFWSDQYLEFDPRGNNQP